MEGDGRIAKDEAKACEYYRQSAEKGYKDVQFQLGYAYETGLGVDKDIHRAIEWYEKVAKQGHEIVQ